MERRIQDKYIYEGLGFPIELRKVEFLKVYGVWAPKINVKKVAEDTIKKLPLQKTRLTGDQVRFIRSYLRMSYREFALRVVHQSHSAVSKWERFGDLPTNMDAATEVVLRLYVFHEVQGKKQNQMKNFLKAYETISRMEFRNSEIG